MLKIGDFSKLARISIRMLRHYNEIGLLVPESIDESNGYRYYREGQLPFAERIKVLRSMGFSLVMVKEILEHYEDPEAFAKFLKVKKTELLEQEKELANQMRLLDSALNRLREEGTMMNYHVTCKTLPRRYVASVRQVIPAYNREGDLWRVLEEVKDQNLKMANPCYSIAIFHDEGFKESNPDVEIQITVEGDYQDTDHVVFKTVEPIQIASATYQGSYDYITKANHAVAKWIADNGYDFDGKSFCIYHVSPAETNDPNQLVTEVCFPVKKIAG